MSLSCNVFDYDADWWWMLTDEEKPLNTKRYRCCKSCGVKVNVGDISRTIRRWRSPNSEVEDKIYGEDGEVSLASWYLCEPCGDLADSLLEEGLCFELNGESIKDQIVEYREEQRILNHGYQK